MILNFQLGGIVSAIYDASLTGVSDWRHNRVRVYDSGSGYYEAGPLGQRNWISRNASRLGVNSDQIKGDGRGRASERADRKVERKGIDLIQFDASSRPLDIA